jgi:type VI secretion system protein VasJ
MGTGLLKGWEDNWDLLPFAFENGWRQMEYMSVRRFTDIRQIADEVGSIKPPDPHWSKFTGQREGQKEFGRNFSGMESKVSDLIERPEFLVPLNSGPSNDPFNLAGLWHFFLKMRMEKIPNAVFMGGIPEEACLAVFKRPLVSRDFVRLWTLFSKEVSQNGSFVTGKRTN